ncbi:hypothetical protein [Escherichia coli]|uniref:hypothetical protein n=1 Tax=Escherichia coli TaxID=562 RepID=UPI00388D0A74
MKGALSLPSRFPPALAESKFTELMFDDDREASTTKTLQLISSKNLSMKSA